MKSRVYCVLQVADAMLWDAVLKGDDGELPGGGSNQAASEFLSSPSHLHSSVRSDRTNHVSKFSARRVQSGI